MRCLQYGNHKNLVYRWVDQENPAKHLKQAMNYIQNPDKTEERVLVGSINCLPETAFEQTMETKQIFRKTDKRQGYHIIISFPPGDATEEQAFEITRRFAEEFLGEQYEVVYYYSKNPLYYKRSNMTSFQKKYYRKIYRLRMIEQKRFYVGSAKYAKDLCELQRLQDEYLLICKNHIETFGGLLDYHAKQEERWNEIESRQKEIYKMRSVKKRSCKSEEDWSEFQI